MKSKSESDRDYFGTFLKTVEKSSPRRADDGTGTRLIKEIRQAGGGIELDELRSRSGVGLVEFTGAVESLRELDLIELKGPEGAERVELTKPGKDLLTALG